MIINAQYCDSNKLFFKLDDDSFDRSTVGILKQGKTLQSDTEPLQSNDDQTCLGSSVQERSVKEVMR